MEVRSSLEAQRQQLVQALTAAVPPRVVDASSTAGDLVPAALTTRLAIGAVLGIVLGVALAATRESLRPTLSGPMIARHLGAPSTGTPAAAPRADTGVSDPWLPNYLMLAADAAGVGSVGSCPSVGRWTSPAWPEISATGRAARGRPARARPGGTAGEEGPAQGVRRARRHRCRDPDVVKGTALFADIERHSELARRPIIGVITYRGRAGSRRSVPRATVRHSASTESVEQPVAGAGS